MFRIFRKCPPPHDPHRLAFFRGGDFLDQIFSLWQILDSFIHFAAAFDSVDRESLWKILKHDGLPFKLVQLVKAMYARTANRIRAGASTSSDFDVSTGVRQGAILSPMLFTRVIDWVMANAVDAPRLGLTVGGSRISDLAFADDIALLAETPEELQRMLDNIAEQAARVGLVSCAKTTIMCCGIDNAPPFTIYGEDLERVRSFTYLGTECGDVGEQVKSRLPNAQAAFSLLQHRWND